MSEKGYNRYNHLLLVKEAVEFYINNVDSYKSVVDFYKEAFYPKYKKSIATMYNWLATPYERDLKRIKEQKEKREKEASRQKSLFDTI